MATSPLREVAAREALEAAVAAAIELLDALDAAQVDLEPEEDGCRFEDSPDIGNPRLCAVTSEDDEPSLASLNCIGTFIGTQYEGTKWGAYSQENWACGSNNDCEA